MKNILITGAKGFIGKNLFYRLKELKEYNIFEYDINNTDEELCSFIKSSNIIFHLAGVNRPKEQDEFQKVNFGLTDKILEFIKRDNKTPHIIFASSIQVELDNPYGSSKRAAEKLLEKFVDENKINLDIVRMPNVYGKWSRPNYNSVVATFCYNIANDIEIEIHDAQKEISLIYIDDLIDKYLSLIEIEKNTIEYSTLNYVDKINLGELANTIKSFKEFRDKQIIPSFENPLTKKLYSTYLSYLPGTNFSTFANMNFDNRGSLTELIKSQNFGQIFFSTTKQGVTRGNHYHHTKTEKFIVVKGKAEINFRKIDQDEVIKYEVSGDKIEVVDIPPGYTHNIKNIGEEDLVVLFWANEIFNPSKPDTNYLEV